MKQVFAILFTILLISVLLIGCTKQPEQNSETEPIQTLPIATQPGAQSTDTVPQTQPVYFDSEEDLSGQNPVVVTDEIPLDSPENVKATEPVDSTEPAPRQTTEKTEPSTEAAPDRTEHRSDGTGPTELEVIDEYVVTGD